MTTSQTGRRVTGEREAIEAAITGTTLLTAFADTARQWAGTQAYRWRDGTGWRSLTYGELRERVRDLALGLHALGFGAGEFALIWSRNRPEPNIADLAVMHARGVPVFLYNTLAPEQATYIAGHCEATVAIVEDRGLLAKLEKVRPQLPHLRRVILIEGEPGPAGWTAETGELAPTLKRRRRVIAERYAGEIERLCGPVTAGVRDLEPAS